jgi:hypothetical protein
MLSGICFINYLFNFNYPELLERKYPEVEAEMQEDPKEKRNLTKLKNVSFPKGEKKRNKIFFTFGLVSHHFSV